MLTPIFTITQDDEYLHIKIKAPNARISETEIHFEDNDFRFFSKPYYLRLNLPSKVIENGEELADYDSKSGTFVIKVSKLNKGEHFEGLDLLTKLLSINSNQISKKPLIEVIGEEEVNTENNLIESIDEDFDWHLDQTVRQESDDLLLLGEKYGFANMYSGVINRIIDEFNGLIDIKDPERKNLCQRTHERLETEKSDFNDDHYLSDMFDQNNIISDLINSDIFVNDSQIEYNFNDDQRFRLKSLPKKDYILDKNEKKTLLLGMIDILFGYAYDIRINECEPSVESSWNICKLSSTLSWFDSYTSLKQVIVSSIRRSLCYPLYRDWNLSLKVKEDVVQILRFGQNYVIKCFLDIHKMFNESREGRYVLNDLYITDYCVWLQYVKPNTFESLANAIQTLRITKSDIDLDLEILERAAQLAIEEQTDRDLQKTNGENSNSSNESYEDSEELMHKTSSECSSETTETSFSSSEFSEKQLNRKSNEDIDSDDDHFPTKSCIRIPSDSNDSDDESSSIDLDPTNVVINDKKSKIA